MHTDHIKKTGKPQISGKSKNESFTVVQKIIICVFLILTLFLAPTAAVPVFDTEDPGTSWICKNPNSHYCRYAALNLPPNEIFFLPVSGRDLKLPASQKKSMVKSSGAISTTGDVFFADSPVVTGLHLQEGITGNVQLQTSENTSRPEFCNVYNVFELSLENYPQGSETVVRYTLPLAEIEEKGYNPVDIALCIYDNNIWQKLHTIYFMDDQNAYFESVTTSLGTFAIVSDGNFIDSESSPIRLGMDHLPSASLSVTPSAFLTHPVAYTAAL